MIFQRMMAHTQDRETSIWIGDCGTCNKLQRIAMSKDMKKKENYRKKCP
jgi:hypothetical protein